MGKRGKILVIEDDDIFRRTLDNALSNEGYEVTGARDGTGAVELAKKQHFDLIIADVRLPGEVNGIEAARMVREICGDLKIIVIIMTGYADSDAPIRAIKAGVDDYVFKPFSIDTFLHNVKRNFQILNLNGFL